MAIVIFKSLPWRVVMVRRRNTNPPRARRVFRFLVWTRHNRATQQRNLTCRHPHHSQRNFFSMELSFCGGEVFVPIWWVPIVSLIINLKLCMGRRGKGFGTSNTDNSFHFRCNIKNVIQASLSQSPTQRGGRCRFAASSIEMAFFIRFTTCSSTYALGDPPESAPHLEKDCSVHGVACNGV
jgi:hypothetical protein